MNKFPISLAVISGAILAACGGLLNTINCPDCGNNVSVRAVFCPRCGCSKEGIQQQYQAVERASLMTDEQAKSLLGSAYMGQMGRLQFMRDKAKIENVLTNQVSALQGYSDVAKKRALVARDKVVRIQDMGFTLDQIFTMRMDLVSDILGRTK